MGARVSRWVGSITVEAVAEAADRVAEAAAKLWNLLWSEEKDPHDEDQQEMHRLQEAFEHCSWTPV